MLPFKMVFRTLKNAYGKGSFKTAQLGLSLLPFSTGIIYYCLHINESGFDGRAVDKAPLSVFFS